MSRYARNPFEFALPPSVHWTVLGVALLLLAVARVAGGVTI